MVMAIERRTVAYMFNFFRGERTRVQLALITVQLGYGIYYVLTKAAMSGGVNRFVFAVYRDAIALCLLGPMAFFSERNLRTPLTIPICLFIVALGFMGIFLQQTLFLAGLAYTNTAFAAAMQNAIPVFTFMIAVVCKLEVIRMSKPDGMAKVVGICSAVVGAFTMCLYKGPTLFGKDSSAEQEQAADNVATAEPDGWLASTLLSYGVDYWQMHRCSVPGGQLPLHGDLHQSADSCSEEIPSPCVALCFFNLRWGHVSAHDWTLERFSSI